MDETCHEGQKACPMKSIAHGRRFIIGDVRVPRAIHEPSHRMRFLDPYGYVFETAPSRF